MSFCELFTLQHTVMWKKVTDRVITPWTLTTNQRVLMDKTDKLGMKVR